MAQDVKLSVVIEGNAKQLEAAMAAAAAATEASGKGISAILTNVGKKFALATAAAATLGAVLVGGFIKKSVGTFIEFEAAIARMGATLGETNRDTGELNASMEDLEIIIRNIAKESQATASQVARAGNVLALAGLDFKELGNETEGAITSLVDFSVVAGTDVETAAGIVISSVKGMGLEIAEMDRVMDVFVTTMTSSFVDLQTLGMAMKFLSPTAKAAGISIEESAAAIGALGNAGLQGTIAGTGLRMSINKLLSPTDDARRVMERLGLNFLTLTPAGESAKNTMQSLSMSIASTKQEVQRTTAALDILNGKLDSLSIDQQKNQLAIMQIRAKAEREGRELTKDELKRIEKLEQANRGLALQQAEVSIKQQEASREQRRANGVLAEQEKQYNHLNEVVSSQTMGLTSLTDVINQLHDSGATTAEILEIFSVRGGTAIMALMGQRDGYLELVEANRLAEGATESYLKTMKLTVDFQIKQVISAFEETRLVVGELFAELIGLADANDGKIASSLKNVAITIGENEDAFIRLRDTIGEEILPLIAQLPQFVEDMMVAFDLSLPFIKAFADVLELLLIVLDPVFWLLDKIVGVVNKMKESAFGRVILDALAGAAVGALVGGPMGALVGAGVGATGGAVQEFHKGGVTDKPTAGIFGEAGREALVPLTKYEMHLTKKSAPMKSGSGGTASNNALTLNFESITINGGGSMTSGDVRNIIRTEMPKIVKSSYRGARGVI